MKRFAVIGLGHFGFHAAKTLYDAGMEVIAIDLDPEKVQDTADHATQAVVADATDKATLESIGIREVDAAIVSLGERMEVITLSALHVKDLGVPYVAVKALSEDHGRILEAIGVDEVIHPEKDMACRIANRLSRNDVVEFLPLLPGYSIIEIKPPEQFIGRTLAELELRKTLNVQLIAIEHGGDKKRVNVVPGANDKIHADDLLILLGENSDLDRIREKIDHPLTSGRR